MDTALPQKFPFILNRNLAKANCTGNRVCTCCDIVVLGSCLSWPMGPRNAVASDILIRAGEEGQFPHDFGVR